MSNVHDSVTKNKNLCSRKEKDESKKKIAKNIRLLSLGPLALGHTSEPVNEHGSEDVEHNVDPHQAEVAPCIAEVAVHLGQIGVCAGDRAEGTVGGGVRILKVAAVGADVVGHVALAGGVGRRAEVKVFDSFAGGSRAGHTGS